MSGEGLVEKLLCPVDQSILFSNQDLDDNIFLYCLECEYKKNIGTSTYENIVRAVQSVNKNDKL
jgi:DNA-directed RNA polymerase subunit M/transcription elongation factor TFIIS